MTRVTRRENKTAQNDSTGSSVSREKSGLWRCLRRPSRAPFLRGSTRTPITPGATKPRAWTLCLKPGVNQRIKFYLPSGSLTTTLPFLLSPPLPLSLPSCTTYTYLTIFSAHASDVALRSLVRKLQIPDIRMLDSGERKKNPPMFLHECPV